MNFIKNQKDIQALLTTKGGKAYSGCYVYSRDQNDKTKKIGMSQAGLFRRIKQAGACYPFKTEFWLEYIIISLDGNYTKGTKIKSSTMVIEKALHEESKHLSTVKMQEETEPEQGKRPREYRVLSSDAQLRTLLQKTLNLNRQKWDYLVSFSTNGWKIIANDRVKPKPITSADSINPKNTVKTPDIYSLPLNKTKLILPKDLKVKDIIPASDNWKSFEVVKIISKKHIVAKFKNDKKLYDITL
jgi:hypothetical protein